MLYINSSMDHKKPAFIHSNNDVFSSLTFITFNIIFSIFQPNIIPKNIIPKNSSMKELKQSLWKTYSIIYYIHISIYCNLIS